MILWGKKTRVIWEKTIVLYLKLWNLFIYYGKLWYCGKNCRTIEKTMVLK